MSDAKKAFSFLQENIPVWLKDLEEIGQKIQDKHDEIAKVPVPVTPARPLRKKTGSTESLRPKDESQTPIAGELTSAPQAEDVAPSSPFTREQQAILAKRKRKTASVLSSHASGPQKYRSRTMIIVYYDSEVQKAFEMLVRNIGTGRNFLRKGKMVARMQALEEATGVNDESDDDDDDGGEEILAKTGYRPKLGVTAFRSTRTRSGFGGLARTDAQECFDAADKALEKAQSLCEHGAHQFLREGDCRFELQECEEEFQNVIELSKRELERYKEKEEQTKISQQKNAERLQAQIQSRPRSDMMKIDVDDEEEDPEFLGKEPTLASLGPIRLTSRY